MKLERIGKKVIVRPYKKSDFEKILTSQKKNRSDDYFFDFGIFLKDGTLVGGASIMDISRQVFQNAYFGFRVFNNHWGKGYGKEGVRLGIDIASKDLKLHCLEAGIEPKNRRSIAGRGTFCGEK